MSLPVPTWNGCDHSIDNLMSIVVQSLKINGHNYSLESTFLIRNLSGRCGYAPDRSAVFVRNELSQWVLDKNKKYKMNYNFLLDPSVRCEEAVREMHESLKTMDSSLREFQMNQTSLVYEMRGSRNYIANTWIRCEIVSIAFELIAFLLGGVAVEDNDPPRKEDQAERLLEFAQDVMVITGRTKPAAIDFLQQVFVCYGYED